MDNIPHTHALWESLLPTHPAKEGRALPLTSELAISFIPELPTGYLTLGSAMDADEIKQFSQLKNNRVRRHNM